MAKEKKLMHTIRQWRHRVRDAKRMRESGTEKQTETDTHRERERDTERDRGSPPPTRLQLSNHV